MKQMLLVVFFLFFSSQSHAITFVDGCEIEIPDGFANKPDDNELANYRRVQIDGRSTSIIIYESNNFKKSFDRNINRKRIFFREHENLIIEGFVLTGVWRDRLKNYSEVIVQDKDKVLRAVFFERKELSTILKKCLPESIVNNYFNFSEQELR
jgi:hypothetical protein